MTSRLNGPFQFLLGATTSTTDRDSHYNIAAFNADYAAAVLGALTAPGSGAPTPPSYLGQAFSTISPRITGEILRAFAEAYLQVSNRRDYSRACYNNDSKTLRARAALRTSLSPMAPPMPMLALQGGYDADQATPCQLVDPPRSAAAARFGVPIAQRPLHALRPFRVDAWLNDCTMGYVSHSRGYKSGGINLLYRPASRPEVSVPNLSTRSDWQ